MLLLAYRYIAFVLVSVSAHVTLCSQIFRLNSIQRLVSLVLPVLQVLLLLLVSLFIRALDIEDIIQ